MSFGEAIRSGFQNYVTWRGRASRSEYWWWYLFVSLVTLPFSFIYMVVTQVQLQSMLATGIYDPFAFLNWAYFLLIVVVLVLFLPNLSMIIRRLHDTDRSGGWFWIGLVPFVGSIIVFVFMLLPSTPGPNRFDS